MGAILCAQDWLFANSILFSEPQKNTANDQGRINSQF